MDFIMTLSAPQALLELTDTGPIGMYLLYDQAQYLQSERSDGWWQRTLALDPYHWLRLSGAATVKPCDALRLILTQPDRQPIPFPPLMVALFLAHSPNPEVAEQRQAFQWVVYAMREMLPVLPATAREAGWDGMPSDQLDQLTTDILGALLNQASIVPWPLYDGVEVQMFDQMSNMLWTFPPTLTRQISDVAVVYFDQYLEANGQQLGDKDSCLEDSYQVNVPQWSLIGNLSAMRFWRTPWPTIRGLTIQAPMYEVLLTWYQALIIMHPDAPIIDDEELTWLCDGTLGARYDAPFGQLLTACPIIATLNIPVMQLQERIAMLQQEAAQGPYLTSSHWEIKVSEDWPSAWAYGATTVRLVVGLDGCWVRLIPAQWSWGSVLWWRPHDNPPACWTLAFGDDVRSLCLMGLHATLWQIWRNLRVYGYIRPLNGS